MKFWLVFLSFLYIPINLFAQDYLIDFTLYDQFDQKYTQKSFDEKILIIVGADREGSEYSDDWGAEIYKYLASRIDPNSFAIAGVADLSAVPSMLKGMVRKMFTDDPEDWVLMDWEGAFSNTYGFRSESVNIVVFNRNGKKILQFSATGVDQARLREIYEAIK